MQENLERRDDNLMDEAIERKDDIKAATLRKDDLQRQIKELNAHNKSLVEHHKEKTKDDMKSEEFLNLIKNFSQNKDKDSAYQKPTFESDKKLIDWKQDVLQQPRQLSINNVRDIFFSLLNQSKA